MIARIRGKIWEAWPNRLVVDCGGVGYDVTVPASSVDHLNPVEGEEVSLYTYQHVREQAITLFGFARPEDRDIFLLLVDRVSGIGPSTAVAILSGMGVEQFKSSVVNEDAKSLATIKGLGKKTAERIILELKDKVGVAETWKAAESTAAEGGNSALLEAELALIALGFKQVEARKSVVKANEADQSLSAEGLIRAALQNR